MGKKQKKQDKKKLLLTHPEEIFEEKPEETTVDGYITVNEFESFKKNTESVQTKVFNKLVENAALYKELSNDVLDKFAEYNPDRLKQDLSELKTTFDGKINNIATTLETIVERSVVSIEKSLKAVAKEFERQRKQIKTNRIITLCVGVVSVVALILHFVV